MILYPEICNIFWAFGTRFWNFGNNVIKCVKKKNNEKWYFILKRTSRIFIAIRFQNAVNNLIKFHLCVRIYIEWARFQIFFFFFWIIIPNTIDLVMSIFLAQRSFVQPIIDMDFRFQFSMSIIFYEYLNLQIYNVKKCSNYARQGRSISKIFCCLFLAICVLRNRVFKSIFYYSWKVAIGINGPQVKKQEHRSAGIFQPPLQPCAMAEKARWHRRRHRNQ